MHLRNKRSLARACTPPIAAQSVCATLTAVLGVSCAPAATFRPASALQGEQSIEMGAGAVVVTPRPYVQERYHGAGEVWVTGRVAPWLHLSGIGAFDPDAVAVGGAATSIPLRFDRFAGGVEVEAGYAWVAGALPLAVRVVDGVWLYTSPRLGTWGDALTPGIPVGVSIDLGPHFILRAEGQVSWADFKYYNRRFHGGLAAAYQF